MKALVKFGPGREGMAVKEVPIPGIKSNELLVKIMIAGICGTDLHIMEDEYPADIPVILGHEFIGSVVEVGRDVKNFAAGDQVLSMTAASTCKTCTYCRHGVPILCDSRKSLGSGVNGAMAEYMALPADIAFKVPDEKRDDPGMVVCEPLACCIRAVERSSLKFGDVAVIAGPGAMGQLTLILAKEAGGFVIMGGTAIDKERLEFAREHGADAVCDDPSRLNELVRRYAPLGADVAFECSGAVPAFNSLVNVLKKGGNLVQLGIYGKTVPADLDLLLKKELTLISSFASAYSSWERLLKLASQDRLNLSKFVSATFPLDDWGKGFDLALSKQGYKIAIIP